jgi:uncharacterized membrane protein
MSLNLFSYHPYIRALALCCYIINIFFLHSIFFLFDTKKLKLKYKTQGGKSRNIFIFFCVISFNNQNTTTTTITNFEALR